MPRPLFALSLLLFLPGTALWGPEAPRPERAPIFRFVVLARDTIWLGQPIGPLARYARHPGDSVVTVPLGEFDGTDAVEIHRDSTGIVTGVSFRYGPRFDMDLLRERYVVHLGPPERVMADTLVGVRRRAWIWLDEDTGFQLESYAAPIDGAIGSAWMIDRRRHGR